MIYTVDYSTVLFIQKKLYLIDNGDFMTELKSDLNFRINHLNEKRDSLTGLLKYEYFVEEIKNIIVANTNNENFKLAIVYTDFKHFKYLNETFGYNKGNDLLCMYADFSLSDSDVFLGACRIFSDNFIMAVNVSKFTPAHFFNEVDRKNHHFEAEIKHMFLDRHITINAGVYILKDTFNEDIETAISNANYARKEAKRLESDKCIEFTEDMRCKIINDMEMSSSLPKAIENGEIQVFFQPKVDSTTKNVIGAEALVRWIKPDGKFIFPDQFIPLFESNGLIIEIDYYVYRTVFKYIRERLDNELTVVPISMNISRVHFRSDELGIYIKELLEEFQIPTKYIEFELTESIYINSMNKVLPFVSLMHELGIKVSMDDFGSGYSSLNLLNNLPIDILKLDRVFLANDDLTKNQKIILSCVISMAKQLDIRVLCEGVENKLQSDFLSTAGCDMFQGYYFSKPINQTAFEEFLNNNTVDII